MDVVVLNEALNKAQDILLKANSDSGQFWFRIHLVIHDLQLIIDDVDELISDNDD